MILHALKTSQKRVINYLARGKLGITLGFDGHNLSICTLSICSVTVYVTDTPGWGSYDQTTDYENFDQIAEIFEEWFRPGRWGPRFKRTFLLIQDGPYITPENDSSTILFLRQFQMKYGAQVWSNFHIIADTEDNCAIAQESIREFLFVKMECIAVDVLGSPEISAEDLEK